MVSLRVPCAGGRGRDPAASHPCEFLARTTPWSPPGGGGAEVRGEEGGQLLPRGHHEGSLGTGASAWGGLAVGSRAGMVAREMHPQSLVLLGGFSPPFPSSEGQSVPLPPAAGGSAAVGSHMRGRVPAPRRTTLPLSVTPAALVTPSGRRTVTLLFGGAWPLPPSAPSCVYLGAALGACLLQLPGFGLSLLRADTSRSGPFRP